MMKEQHLKEALMRKQGQPIVIKIAVSSADETGEKGSGEESPKDTDLAPNVKDTVQPNEVNENEKMADAGQKKLFLESMLKNEDMDKDETKPNLNMTLEERAKMKMKKDFKELK